MQPESLLKAYGAMAREFDLPQMHAIQLTRTVERFDAPQSLYQMIDTFRPTQGWLCFQSAVRYVAGSEPLFPANSPDGILLNAEFINEQGDSLHVRQIGATWVTTVYAPVRVSNPTLAERAEEFLMDRVDFNAADQQVGTVCYQRLWQQRDIVGIAPVAARFLGFGVSTIAANDSSGVSA